MSGRVPGVHPARDSDSRIPRRGTAEPMTPATLTVRSLTTADFRRCAEIDGEWSEADFWHRTQGQWRGVGVESKGYLVGFALFTLAELGLHVQRLHFDDHYSGVLELLLEMLVARASQAPRKGVMFPIKAAAVRLNELLRADGYKAAHLVRGKDILIMERRV